MYKPFKTTNWENYGFEKDAAIFKQYKTDIYERNYRMLLYLSASLFFLGILFLFLNLTFHVFNANTKYIYLFWVASSALVFLPCKLQKRWMIDHATALLYVYLAGIMLSMIVSGTFFYKDAASAIMIGCIASMPVILFDKQWRFCIFDIFICLTFVIFSFIAKDSSIAIIDSVNAFSFCFISCLIGRYTIRLKFADLLSRLVMAEKIKTDQLTGLMSRNAVISQIEDYFAASHQGMGALFIIDIDHFKKINDTFGHLQGDRILYETAGIIKSSFRENDYKARLGGDEFLVFMKDVESTSLVCQFAEKLNRNFEKQTFAFEQEIHLTVSIGITVCQQCGSFEEIYEQADQMLYQVKGESRNGYKLYAAL